MYFRFWGELSLFKFPVCSQPSEPRPEPKLKEPSRNLGSVQRRLASPRLNLLDFSPSVWRVKAQLFALQDSWVPKFRFSRRLPLVTICSCPNFEVAPSRSGTSEEGGVEVCKGKTCWGNPERRLPSCHHTCDIPEKLVSIRRDERPPPSRPAFQASNFYRVTLYSGLISAY